jgi:heme exporter protein A
MVAASVDAVSVEEVWKAFGPVRALVGVSARFEAARVTCIEGSNGSGKSTLLAVLGTLARPTAGRVDHGALGRTRAEVRARLGWVGHESLCYPDLSGRENVELAARLHGVDAEQAFARVAERFELGAFAERPVRTYSRGQRQRVALARALVHEPRLLLLDEPTTGLDAKSVERLLRVMSEEAGRGAIVVVVTHDRAVVRELDAARIELDRGRRVA